MKGLIRSFYQALYAIHRSALRRPRTWLAGFLVLLAPALYFAGHVRTLTAIDDIVDADFKTTRDLQRLKDLFKDRNSLFLLFQTKDGKPFENRELCAIRDWITRQSAFNPDVLQTLSPFSIRRAERDGRRFSYPEVLDYECSAEALAEDKDPYRLAKRFEEFRGTPWEGNLVPRGSDGSDFGAEFYLSDNAEDPRHGSFDPSIVREMKRGFEETVAPALPRLRTTWGGLAVFQYYTDEGYRYVDALNVGVVLVLVALMFAFFGTWSASIVLVGTLLATALLLRGVMGAFGIPVELLSNNLFMMLTVSCIEDFLFLSYIQRVHAGAPWRRAFRLVLVPSFLTSLTTAVGFISLGTSDLSMIRRFGFLAGAGAMIEWGMVFLLLPAFASLFPRARTWVRPVRGDFFARLDRMLRWKLPRAWAWLLLAVFPLGVYGAFHLHFRENPEHTFWRGHPFREGLGEIQRTRGFRSMSSLIFEADVSRARKAEVLAQVGKHPKLTHVERYPPAIDFTYARVSPETRRSFESDFIDGGAIERWRARTGEERAILYWDESETNAINDIRLGVEKACGGDCFLAGSLISYGEFGSRVRDTLFESLWISLVLVGAILVGIAHSLGFRDHWRYLVSSFWGPMCMVVALWVFKVNIYFISCLFATTLVGLAGDNVIQFLWGVRPRAGRVNPRAREDFAQLGGAAFVVILSAIAIALCFLGAYFVPARSLGVLLAAGFFTMFVGDYWLLKGLDSSDES